jgi:hypothetical protein
MLRCRHAADQHVHLCVVFVPACAVDFFGNCPHREFRRQMSTFNDQFLDLYLGYVYRLSRRLQLSCRLVSSSIF